MAELSAWNRQWISLMRVAHLGGGRINLSLSLSPSPCSTTKFNYSFLLSLSSLSLFFFFFSTTRMIDASSFDSEGPSGSLFALTLSLSPPLQTPLASCSRSDLIYLWLNCYARWEFNCARRRWKGDGLWVVLDLLSKLIGGNLDTTFQLSYESTICKIETNKNPFLLNYYLENHASKESNPDQRYLLVPLGWSKTKNRSQGVF